MPSNEPEPELLAAVRQAIDAEGAESAVELEASARAALAAAGRVLGAKIREDCGTPTCTGCRHSATLVELACGVPCDHDWRTLGGSGQVACHRCGVTALPVDAGFNQEGQQR